MNNKITQLINSNKYIPLELKMTYNKGTTTIHTKKYNKEYEACIDVLDTDDIVCRFDENQYTLGLIDSYVTSDDCYNWDEELELQEQTFCNSFIPQKDMKLFLEFELDLLNILSESEPKIIKDIKVHKSKFDTNTGMDFETKFRVTYKGQDLMRYYYDDIDHTYHCSLLSCANINWEVYIDFPTWDNYDDDYWDVDDDDWYTDDDEEDAGITEYATFSYEDAKNIIYTLLHELKNL